MEGFIKFFGTGGARFVALRQTRATGGLWLNYRDTNLYIDPGPGAIVRLRASKERFDPLRLNGMILTHKHLDHANDVNIMIEAMTDGGFKKRGVLFCPEDAINGDPVVMNYLRPYLEEIICLKEGMGYTMGDITFSTPVLHIHPVETYGLLFHLNKKIALISDTRFFPRLLEAYTAEILIVNLLRSKPFEKNDAVDHLALDDFINIIDSMRPKIAIMTHFGMNIIKEKPYLIAERIKRDKDIEVIAAYDGMKFEF